MRKHFDGLSTDANVKLSIIQAQLDMLRLLELAARPGMARTVVTGPGAAIEVSASRSPAEE